MTSKNRKNFPGGNWYRNLFSFRESWRGVNSNYKVLSVSSSTWRVIGRKTALRGLIFVPALEVFAFFQSTRHDIQLKLLQHDTLKLFTSSRSAHSKLFCPVLFAFQLQNVGWAQRRRINLFLISSKTITSCQTYGSLAFLGKSPTMGPEMGSTLAERKSKRRRCDSSYSRGAINQSVDWVFRTFVGFNLHFSFNQYQRAEQTKSLSCLVLAGRQWAVTQEILLSRKVFCTEKYFSEVEEEKWNANEVVSRVEWMTKSFERKICLTA